MKDFFYGMRRKAGVTTLVLACVFMGGWMRSRWYFDRLELPNGKPHNNYVVLLSCHSQIGLVTSSAQSEPTDKIVTSWRFQSEALGDDLWNGLPKQLETDHSIERFGFRYGKNSVTQLGTMFSLRLYMLPYWSIVLPLTLLAGYLILWKPRKRD